MNTTTPIFDKHPKVYISSRILGAACETRFRTATKEQWFTELIAESTSERFKKKAEQLGIATSQLSRAQLRSALERGETRKNGDGTEPGRVRVIAALVGVKPEELLCEDDKDGRSYFGKKRRVRIFNPDPIDQGTRLPFPNYLQDEGVHIRSATSEDLIWINKKQLELYGKDAVPAELYTKWYHANPTGFFVFDEIQDGKSTTIGHITFLAIKDETLQRYIAGHDFVEQDIKADDLHSKQDRAEITSIYVESYISDLKKESITNTIFELYPTLIDKIARNENIRTIYAMSATDKGRNLLIKNGFHCITPWTQRLDKHDMWAISYKNLLASLQKRYATLTIN